jgi:hypothetical protein
MSESEPASKAEAPKRKLARRQVGVLTMIRIASTRRHREARSAGGIPAPHSQPHHLALLQVETPVTGHEETYAAGTYNIWTGGSAFLAKLTVLPAARQPVCRVRARLHGCTYSPQTPPTARKHSVPAFGLQGDFSRSTGAGRKSRGRCPSTGAGQSWTQGGQGGRGWM